jgi:hypothetical protein
MSDKGQESEPTDHELLGFIEKLEDILSGLDRHGLHIPAISVNLAIDRIREHIERSADF